MPGRLANVVKPVLGSNDFDRDTRRNLETIGQNREGFELFHFIREINFEIWRISILITLKMKITFPDVREFAQIYQQQNGKNCNFETLANLF